MQLKWGQSDEPEKDVQPGPHPLRKTMKVVGRFVLEPVGKDWDGTYKPLDQLSYMDKSPAHGLAELAKQSGGRIVMFRIGDENAKPEEIEPDEPHIVE